MVKTKPGEGPLHPRPKGRGIRDPLHSLSNKSSKQLPKGLFLDLICISQKDFALKWGFVGQKPCIPIVYVTSRFSKESV